MSDGPFDGMLMIDPSAATAEKAARNRIAGAVAKALTATLGREGIDLNVAEVAATVADIVAGRSAVLHLAHGDEDHRAAARSFLESMLKVTRTIAPGRQEAAVAKLAEVILPDDLASARGPIAADNLALRDRFVAETSPLTSAEVAALAGHRSRNVYATAARWRKSGDIFSVHHRGTEYYPAFQFRDGRPHPAVAKVLAALPETMSPWQRAFWFVSANGWLNDATPADMLDDTDAVVAASRHERDEVVG